MEGSSYVSKTYQSSVFNHSQHEGNVRQSNTFKSNLSNNIFNDNQKINPTKKQLSPSNYTPNYNQNKNILKTEPDQPNNTFKSNLPIFDDSQKMMNRRKTNYEQFSPKFKDQSAISQKLKEFHGEQAALRSQQRSPDVQKKVQQDFDIKRHYHSEFQGNGIFEDQKTKTYEKRQEQQKEIKQIEKRDTNREQRRIKENYGEEGKQGQQEYKNIKNGFVDDQNDKKRRANHNYSNLHNLESNPQQDVTQKNLLTANTQKWHHVQQSVNIEAQSPKGKKMMMMSSVLGNQDLYRKAGDSSGNKQEIDVKINNLIHQDIHNEKRTDQQVTNQQVEVFQFNFKNQEQTVDPLQFTKKCKQQGIHLMNYEPLNNPVNPGVVQQGAFKVRTNKGNEELMANLGQIAKECGQKIERVDKTHGMINKNLSNCTNTECFDEKLQQEKKPDQHLDSYTRKVNNLRQSDQQHTLHEKTALDKDDINKRQNLMNVHDYYNKIKKLDSKLTKLSLQSQQRKKQ